MPSAVEQAVLYMRERVPVVRRRQNGPVIEEQAKDLIAAEYRHTTARGVSGAQAPDPQLHSHVVITAVVREDERVVAVGSRPVFRGAREIGALYRRRSRTSCGGGYEISRRTGKDGKYFEIAGVPEAGRGVLRALPRGRPRRRAIQSKVRRAPKRGELRNLALENRRSKTADHPRGPAACMAGDRPPAHFDAREALRLLAAEPPRTGRTIEDRVETRLTEHHAVFDRESAGCRAGAGSRRDGS